MSARGIAKSEKPTAKRAKGRVAILNHQGTKTPRRSPRRGQDVNFGMVDYCFFTSDFLVLP
jgi:hypothetical protein